MKKYISILLTILLSVFTSNAQEIGIQDTLSINRSANEYLISPRSTSTANYSSFFVEGNRDTYYPVVFTDGGWQSNEATILEIGRSDIHQDKAWNGSLISRFRFHLTRFGNGSQFVDADIRQSQPQQKYFIAGWQDITGAKNGLNLIIWMRGDATYMYRSNYPQKPLFTSGAITIEGSTYQPKTSIDSYVNLYGKSLSGSLKVNSMQPSTFASKVGIGTSNPQDLLDVSGNIRSKSLNVDTELIVGKQEEVTEGSINRIKIIPYRHTGGPWVIRSRDTQSIASLDLVYGSNNLVSFHHDFRVDVNGSIRAKEVKVEVTSWSDFVFAKEYKLPSLEKVEKHIQKYRHLPDIPSEKEVIENGVNIVEIQAKLLQKIEELTLYVIEQDKRNQSLQSQIEELRKQIQQ